MATDEDMNAPVDASLLDEQAEDLYENAPCGYLSTLPDGTIVKVNGTFERWTGHDRATLIGTRRFQDLLTPGGRIYHETHYRPLLQMQGSVREIAVEILAADGRRLPVLMNSVLRRDADGTPRIVRTTIFDATDRRRYERELLAARQRAERLQRHASLLADTSRVLDEVPGAAERAQRLVDLLARRTGVSAVLAGIDPIRVLASAGPRAEDPALRAAMRDALGGIVPQPAEEAQVAAVPLRIAGRLLGALGIVRSAAGDAFVPDDLPLMSDLADRVALALETARLYDHQRDVALVLQRSMLAGEMPDDPRCTLGSFYSPAVDTLEVGGDWYDAFALDDDHIALVMGDIVGRGLEAAATMGQLRSAVRALALTRLGPAGVLARLDAFVDLTESARSATVAYAELDLKSGTLRLACAGHPPPIVLARDAPPSLLWDGRLTPLGTYGSEGTRIEGEVRLEPGTRLLLYTDGFVERRDLPIDRGIDLLMEAFARHAGTELADLGEHLSTELLATGGAGDDACLLAVELAGADS